MNCPVCDGRLRAVGKYGVDVDICPDCKGVWLDRGELDKILEMADAGGPAELRQERPEERQPEHREERGRDREGQDRDSRDRQPERRPEEKRRRGSWLGDIMDSFGGGGD